MKFSYNELKIASKNGDQLGKWKGYNVFTCTKNELNEMGSGVVFIVYDDKNALVRKVSDTWRIFGYVSEDGHVTELNSPLIYTIKEQKMTYCYDTKAYEPVAQAYDTAAEAAANVCGKEEKCEAAHEVAVGDVKLGIDVDKVLQAAREMTVDSLLAGFNYGL